MDSLSSSPQVSPITHILPHCGTLVVIDKPILIDYDERVHKGSLLVLYILWVLTNA